MRKGEKMKSYLKGLKWNMVIMAVLTIVMGIALVANPNAAALTICRLLGWIVLISAVVSVFFYLNGGRSFWETSALVLAVIGVIAGIYIIRRPWAIVKFLGYLMAGILLVHGINDVREANEARNYRDEHWGVALVLGVINIIFGILIVWNPFSSAAVLMTIIGIALVYDGATDLLIVLRVSKFAREIKREMNDDIID